MLPKSNHDLKGKCPYIFLWVHFYPYALHISRPKTAVFFCIEELFENTKEAHNDMKFSETIIVVNKWLRTSWVLSEVIFRNYYLLFCFCT